MLFFCSKPFWQVWIPASPSISSPASPSRNCRSGRPSIPQRSSSRSRCCLQRCGEWMGDLFGIRCSIFLNDQKWRFSRLLHTPPFMGWIWVNDCIGTMLKMKLHQLVKDISKWSFSGPSWSFMLHFSVGLHGGDSTAAQAGRGADPEPLCRGELRVEPGAMGNQEDWGILTDWWFGTFFMFPYIGNNLPSWLTFFSWVETTSQLRFCSIKFWGPGNTLSDHFSMMIKWQVPGVLGGLILGGS